METNRQTFGFSLVEVNLAIFVVSMGILTLFSLFPAGLRQVADSHAATQEALFADYVLSTVRANASGIGAEDWVDMGQFRNAVMGDLDGIDADVGMREISFGSAEQRMRYKLDIGSSGNNRRSFTLLCKAVGGGGGGYSVEIGDDGD